MGDQEPRILPEGTDHGTDDGRHSFVFVGGLHRSGTTLIANTLSEHPAISGLEGTGVPEDEGQHLQSVFPIALDMGGFGRFGFSDDAHMTEASRLVSPDTRDRLFTAWAPYWDLEKPILLEKSPPNLLKMRFLHALFPDSYFVIVLRHPLAVTYATQRMSRRWKRFDVHTHIKHWLTCYEAALLDAIHLHRVAAVRYEDFIKDPGAELARLYAWLGLPPQPPGSEVRSGLNEAYFERWFADRWNPVKRRYTAYIGREFDRRTGRFGYGLSDASTGPFPSDLAQLDRGQPQPA